MDANELKLQRRNTAAFIAANSIQIALIPRKRVNTGTGSRLVDEEPRTGQTFRLIDQTRTFGAMPGLVIASDGKQRKADYQLLGEHDVVIGLYDYWIDAYGTKFEVGELLARNGYERRAQVVRYGEG